MRCVCQRKHVTINKIVAMGGMSRNRKLHSQIATWQHAPMYPSRYLWELVAADMHCKCNNRDVVL